MPADAPTPVYLDCDTGVDDAAAIALLLASPEVRLVGIGSVSGNIDAARGARNTLDLLALAGRSDIPVAVGEHDYSTEPFPGGAASIHGENGIGDTELDPSSVAPIDGDAAHLLIRLAHEHAGELRVLTIGPLTNIAKAIAIDPHIVELVRDVTIMGGAALVPGNISAVAEANIAHDAEAAAAVMRATWPIVLVPLDVTLDHALEDADHARLAASDRPFARAIASILDLYLDFYVGFYGRRACALHDPLAAALLIGCVTATVAPAVPVVVDETRGPGHGQTVCDLRGQRGGSVDREGAHVRVVLATDVQLAPILVERVLSI